MTVSIASAAFLKDQSARDAYAAQRRAARAAAEAAARAAR